MAVRLLVTQWWPNKLTNLLRNLARMFLTEKPNELNVRIVSNTIPSVKSKSICRNIALSKPMRKINSTVYFRPKPNVAYVALELSNPLDGLSDSLEMQTNSLSFLISGPQTDGRTDRRMGALNPPPPLRILITVSAAPSVDCGGRSVLCKSVRLGSHYLWLHRYWVIPTTTCSLDPLVPLFIGHHWPDTVAV